MSRAVATVLMPLAALKRNPHEHPFEFVKSCNCPNAACGIETRFVIITNYKSYSCNCPNAACGIEIALPFLARLIFLPQMPDLVPGSSYCYWGRCYVTPDLP